MGAQASVARRPSPAHLAAALGVVAGGLRGSLLPLSPHLVLVGAAEAEVEEEDDAGLSATSGAEVAGLHIARDEAEAVELVDGFERLFGDSQRRARRELAQGLLRAQRVQVSAEQRHHHEHELLLRRPLHPPLNSLTKGGAHVVDELAEVAAVGGPRRLEDGHLEVQHRATVLLRLHSVLPLEEGEGRERRTDLLRCWQTKTTP